MEKQHMDATGLQDTHHIDLKNGERLYYKKTGIGTQNLILIHGNICAGLHFEPILPHLLQEFCVYIPDLRGFGESSYVSAVESIEDLVEDLQAFISQLDIQNFLLVGWSAGGCICMQYAASYPNSLKALILVGSVGYKGCPILDETGSIYTDVDSMKREPKQIAPVLEAIENQDVHFMKTLWDQAIFTKEKPREKDAQRYAEASLKQRNLAEYYWALSKFNMSHEENGYGVGNGQIENIKVPVLLLWGNEDKIVTRKETVETAAAFGAKSRMVVLENCGHSPFLDCPEILVAYIQEMVYLVNKEVINMSKSFRETVVGAWKLVEYSIENKNKRGEKFYPLGKDATGFILYTPDGYMSAQIMASGRPIYANGHLHTGTIEEMSKAAKGYMAYSGQYEVDEETQTLYHHMEVSMNPTWVGQTQERFIKLEGDTITITNSNNNAVLIWKRAEDHGNR